MTTEAFKLDKLRTLFFKKKFGSLTSYKSTSFKTYYY